MRFSVTDRTKERLKKVIGGISGIIRIKSKNDDGSNSKVSQILGVASRLQQERQEKSNKKDANNKHRSSDLDDFTLQELIDIGIEAGIDPICIKQAYRKIKEKEMQNRKLARNLRFIAPAVTTGFSLYFMVLACATTPTPKLTPYSNKIVAVETELPPQVKTGLTNLSLLLGLIGTPVGLAWAMSGLESEKSKDRNRKTTNNGRISNRKIGNERRSSNRQVVTDRRQLPRRSERPSAEELSNGRDRSLTDNRSSKKNTLPAPINESNERDDRFGYGQGQESSEYLSVPLPRTASLPLRFEDSIEPSTSVSDRQTKQIELSEETGLSKRADNQEDRDKTIQKNGDTKEVNSWVNDSAILFFGRQGGGKTSKAGYNAANHVRRGDRVIYVNPIGRLLFWKGIESYGLPTTKLGTNPNHLQLERIKDEKYQDAIRGLWIYIQEIERRLALCGGSDFNPYLEQHIHLVCDEMTDWEAEIENRDNEVLRRLTVVVTQYLRQANGSTAFVTHGETLACMGGAKALNGKSNVIRNTFKRVQCQAVKDASVPGGYTCAGWAKIFDPGEEFSRKAPIPVGCEPPNKGSTPTGMAYYDFTPLIQQQPKIAATKLQVTPQIATENKVDENKSDDNRNDKKKGNEEIEENDRSSDKDMPICDNLDNLDNPPSETFRKQLELLFEKD